VLLPLAMSHTLTVEYGEEVLLATGQSPSELLRGALRPGGEARRARSTLLRPRREGCGMAGVAFLLALPRVGVKVSNMSADDLDDELAVAQHG